MYEEVCDLRLRFVFFSTTAPDFEAVRLPFDCLLMIFFEPLVAVLGVVGGAIFSLKQMQMEMPTNRAPYIDTSPSI